uniref:C-type lectin domain-containing protein n=1 Tax=Macrostomum lignano TaxID=282301 RepID=A0A1I8F3G8_9PLAT
ELESGVKRSYGSVSLVTTGVDSIQSEMRCCGWWTSPQAQFENSCTWFNGTTWYKANPVDKSDSNSSKCPSSCCADGKANCKSPYAESCTKKIFKKYLVAVPLAAVAAVILCLCHLLCAVVLLKQQIDIVASQIIRSPAVACFCFSLSSCRRPPPPPYLPTSGGPASSRSWSAWPCPLSAASPPKCVIRGPLAAAVRASGWCSWPRAQLRPSLFLFSRVCHLLSLSSAARRPALGPADCELFVDSEMDALVSKPALRRRDGSATAGPRLKRSGLRRPRPEGTPLSTTGGRPLDQRRRQRIEDERRDRSRMWADRTRAASTSQSGFTGLMESTALHLVGSSNNSSPQTPGGCYIPERTPQSLMSKQQDSAIGQPAVRQSPVPLRRRNFP